MNKNWNTTKLMSIGALAVLHVLIQILFITTVFVSSGSILGTFLFIIIGPFFVVFTPLVVNKFGSATIFKFMHSLLSIPIPKVYPQIANLLLGPFKAIFVDVIFLKFNDKKLLSSLISGGVYNFLMIIETIILFFTIGLESGQNLPSFLLTPIGLTIETLIVTILGVVTGYGTYLIYKKLENTNVVRRIQGEKVE